MRKLLLLLLGITCGLTASAYDFEVDGLCYDKNGDGKSVTVTYELNNDYSNYSSLSASLNGVLTIPGAVTYDGTTYTVTEIGQRAFLYCTGLTSVTIPNSVTEIGQYAFRACIGLTSVDIPNSVALLANYAFYGCFGLTSVDIPNSVTELGYYAFYGCSGLTSVEIPNSVTYIGSGAFSNCAGLTSISVASDNSAYDSRDNCNAIVETSSNTLIAGCRNTIIPNTITAIGDGAFYGCGGLTSIDIPNSVSLIGGSAFYGCGGLTSVTIPDVVTSIGQYAFAGCTGLTGIDIPNSVAELGRYSFYKCTGLTDVIIGNSVTSIGDYAFKDCGLIENLVAKREEPVEINESVFDGVPKATCILHVMPGSGEKYSAQEVWKDFLNIVEDADKYGGVSLTGDVNADGRVNAGDVSAVYNVMLGATVDETIASRADVNADGSVNAGDVSAVYNSMLE